MPMMGSISFAINLGVAASGGLAAYYWYDASRMATPERMLLGTTGFDVEAEFGGHNVLVDTGPLTDYLKESGRRNKIAATWSALAAFLTALSAGASLLA